jgi:hypothetical protein
MTQLMAALRAAHGPLVRHPPRAAWAAADGADDVLTPEQIFCACRAAEGAGADFVKSSTGFHPVGPVPPSWASLAKQ